MNELDLTRCTVGDRAEISVDVTEDLVGRFAEYSGDRNPLHLDPAYAEGTRFKRRVAHGMSYAALFSRLIGMDLPGPGALWMSQSFRFAKPAFIGDRLTLSVEIEKLTESTGAVTLACRAVNQLGDEIMSGTGEVMMLETARPAARPEAGA
ncbi:MAG: MaoC family dehydratase, partial [Rhodospirillaceae bacterium]|nr:MaoC family dehydratase [Rhodospirillaceae bacterium]